METHWTGMLNTYETREPGLVIRSAWLSDETVRWHGAFTGLCPRLPRLSAHKLSGNTRPRAMNRKVSRVA